MQVTNIRVSFMREKQPVQYEKAQPMVELAGTLEDGENHLTVARNLMLDAAAVVYAGIGYSIPEKVANALLSLGEDGTLAVAVQSMQAKAEVDMKKGSVKDEVKPATKKPRGRPKGSTNKKTSEAEVQKIIDDAKEGAGIEAGIPGDEERGAVTVPSDEIPGDDVPNISSGNEDRVDPADEMGEFTPKDLHDLIINHVKASPRTLSVQNARSILAHFKVARAQDLTNEQAVEGRVMLNQMVAEEAAA